jgi:DNA-binding XRE family transcriptional regulator
LSDRAWGEQLTTPRDHPRLRDSEGSAEARIELGLLVADLRDARKRRRLTQVALGEAMDVSALAIGSWESGKDTPSTGNFLRLAESLGFVVDVADRMQRPDTARPVLLRGESLEAYRMRCMMLVLADARRRRDYTQEMVGDRLGVSAWTIHMWETAHRNPRLLRLIEWCAVLDCRLTLIPV